MSVLIKRNTGWMGTVSNFQIQVSGEKVASVMNHQHIQINLQDGAARLQASQFGIKRKWRYSRININMDFSI